MRFMVRLMCTVENVSTPNMSDSAAPARTVRFSLRREEMCDECVVCYDETPHRIGPCGHAMCPACVAKWCSRSPTCPLCRADTFGLTEWTPPCTELAVIPFPKGTHPGITLRRVEGGMRVVKLDKRDQCYLHGIKPGMVLQMLNGVPCEKAEDATRLMDSACRSEFCVVCKVAPAGAARRWWWPLGR